MSNSRRLRRGLNKKSVRTAMMLKMMVDKVGSYEAVKTDFEGAINKTFLQREIEVFEPANRGASA